MDLLVNSRRVSDAFMMMIGEYLAVAPILTLCKPNALMPLMYANTARITIDCIGSLTSLYNLWNP